MIANPLHGDGARVFLALDGAIGYAPVEEEPPEVIDVPFSSAFDRIDEVEGPEVLLGREVVVFGDEFVNPAGYILPAVTVLVVRISFLVAP